MSVWQILSGSRVQQTWASMEGSDHFSEDEDSGSDEGEANSSSMSSVGDTHAPLTESHLLYHSILEAITSLLKLSMFIRKSARSSKFARSSAAQRYETQYDITHVRDRYPHASENRFLIERLGKANAQRRQWLAYRKRHRDKMAESAYFDTGSLDAEQIPTTEIDRSRDVKFSDDLLSSITSSDRISGPRSTLSSTRASTFHRNTEPEQEQSETDQSEISYPESSYGNDGQDINLIPQPPPQSLNEQPFECPYCFMIITITGNQSWT